MQRLLFAFLCLLVSAFARRSIPEGTTPRAFLPRGYLYGSWGAMPYHPEPEVKKEDVVKQVNNYLSMVPYHSS